MKRLRGERSLVYLRNWKEARVVGAAQRGPPGRVRRQAGPVRSLPGGALGRYIRASCRHEIIKIQRAFKATVWIIDGRGAREVMMLLRRPLQWCR